MPKLQNQPITTMLVWLTVSLLLACSVEARLQIGQPAPGFTATDAQGNEHQLADYRGRLVVLEWTNHQCPYVRKHYDAGNMQAQQAAATDNGTVWLSVISSAPGKQGHVSPAEAQQLTQARNAEPTAVLLDPQGEIGRRYGARTTPHMFIIDRQGTLVYQGGIDAIPSADPADIAAATQYIPQALSELRAGKPVSVPVTRPYGCSVKY